MLRTTFRTSGRGIFVAAVAVTAAGLALSGCGSASGAGSAAGSANSPGKKLGVVEMINPAPGAAAWQSIQRCFTSEAAKKGVTAKVVGSSGDNFDISQTLELIQQAVADKVGAIAVLTSGGASTLASAIQQARAKGVYVATMESGDATPDRNFDVGINIPGYADKMAALIESMPGQKNVGILSINLTGTSKIFLDEMKRALSDDAQVKIEGTVLDNGNVTVDADQVSGMLAAHPGINVIVTDNPGQIAGAATAIKEKGLTGKTRAIGISLDPNTESALENGTAAAIAVQRTCDVGQQAVDGFVDLSAGKAVPKNIPVTLEWATKGDWKSFDPNLWN
jgi:ribose transport system substrate-binding protein